MTRYSNPLPHGQVPGPHGRPAGAGAPQPLQPSPDFDAPAWPAANLPRTAGRPASSQGYGDPAGYAPEPHLGYAPDPQPAAPQDPYAALRPDGYGYVQPPHPAAPPPPDAYGLAGYTAPHSAAPLQGYAARAPQPAPPRPSYPAPHAQAAYPHGGDAFGAGNGFAPPGSATAGGSAASFAAASQQPAPPAHGYASAPPPPAYGSFGGQAGYGLGHAESASGPLPDAWGGPGAAHGRGVEQGLSADPRDYGHYAAPVSDHSAQWGDAGDPYGEPHPGEAGFGGAAYPPAHAPQSQGAFDQSYAEDDLHYDEPPRRGGWKKVVALVACTVLVGGVLTVAYSTIMDTNSSGPTPLVKGEAGPAKVKPSDPGGKQFAHTDSKIMGRLGENSAEPADPQGVRKVPVVVVGRDGSIQPPAPAQPPPQEQTRAVVAVPGLTVIDGLDSPSPSKPAAPAAAPAAPVPPAQAVLAKAEPPRAPEKKQAAPIAVKPLAAPEKAPVAVPAKAVAAELPKKQKVAAAPAATGPRPTGAGYVAVLASVPASGSSRIDALKQFADMQQKYGTILQNKTPDIQEANLGEKGTYHRLLVGPPGSRDAASSVCTQLKAEGYSGCWVTAY